MTREFRKSSRSQGGVNECVEVSIGTQDVLIRDSKAPRDGMLNVAALPFRRLVADIKAEQFNL